MRDAGRLFKMVLNWRRLVGHFNWWTARTAIRDRLPDVIDPILQRAAEAIGPTLEGKTERLKNRHPPRSLVWLARIVAELARLELLL